MPLFVNRPNDWCALGIGKNDDKPPALKDAIQTGIVANQGDPALTAERPLHGEVECSPCAIIKFK